MIQEELDLVQSQIITLTEQLKEYLTDSEQF
jgi:hypothetical protein